MRKISSILTLILVVCLTVGGVSAAWVYAAGGVVSVFEDLLMSMGTWEFTYTIYFKNNGETLHTVTKKQGEAYTITAADTAAAQAVLNKQDGFEGYEISHWMNAGSTAITGTGTDQTEDIILYPSFKGRFTATFVAQDGSVLDWTTIPYTTNNNGTIKIGDYSSVTAMGTELKGLNQYTDKTVPDANREVWGKLHNLEDLTFDYWQVQIKNRDTITKTAIDKYDFTTVDRDITLYPVYTFNGDVNLIPVDTNGDGEPNYYQVGGYNNANGQAMVEIPDKVNGVEVTEILADAFSGYDGVHSLVIPKTITTVGGNVLATDWGRLDSGETVTIYYEGSYADWIALEATFDDGWADGLSASSRIFFLNGGETVDTSQGYLQASTTSSWGTPTGISWTKSTITSDIVSEYTGYCDCKISTEGDTGHTYVDASGNVMTHNENGTPVNASGTEIYLKESGTIFKTYTLTDGTNTYYRYRPDKKYWDGVTVS